MASDPLFSAPPSSSGPAATALFDPHRMRQAPPGLLSLALMEARNHTLQLFSQFQAALESSDFQAPLQVTVNPPHWTLGHIGWFQEWWIARNMQRSLGARCESTHARLASIEPQADHWWSASQVSQADRWTLDLPDARHTRAYLLDTLEGSLELLEKTVQRGHGPGAALERDATDDALYFYRLSLFHEDMQGEVLAQAAQTLGLPLDKAFQAAFMPPPQAVRDALLVPATRWQMGCEAGDGRGFAFDNEQPVQAIDVPAFEIDAQPVTWSQYVEFVGDGGYDNEAFWHPQGWHWLQRLAAQEGRRGPRYVDQIGVASGAVMQTRFGQPMRMLGNQPAMHMSWWEADAWCRWAGRRLPAEVEWEVAAVTAARRGFRWGDVWEWTGTTFRGYPGFSAGPVADYSQQAFGTQKVLRGASFATRARLKHPRFRHFQPPGCDEVFCGFRSCAV